ncbi:MAG: hypothetical protein ACOYBJ_02060 [Patescibacteria group bacterium]|jgi:Na+/melibiose symporter-like transporter
MALTVSPWCQFWSRVRFFAQFILGVWSFVVSAGLGLLSVAVCFMAIAATNDVDRLTPPLALASLLVTWSISAAILHIARSVADEQLP